MHGDRDGSQQDIRCVLTRFGLRSRRFLLPTYLDYRGLARQIAVNRPPGLLRFAFLVENPTTCYSVSLWNARPLFSAAVPEHIDVVRRMFGRLEIDEERGPELWSTTWRLAEASSNLNWDDLNLGQLLAAASIRGGGARAA